MTPRRLTPLLLVLALAGCTTQKSSANFTGDKKAVADVVDKLETASTGRKAQDICSDVLTRALADSFKASGGECVREIDRAIRDADDSKLKVKAVTVSGSTAQARVEGRIGSGTATKVLGFAREGRAWRISDLGR